MAVDTASKRYSIISLGAAWRGILPPPSGSFDAGDRAHLLALYSGIELGSTPTEPTYFEPELITIGILARENITLKTMARERVTLTIPEREGLTL